MRRCVIRGYFAGPWNFAWRDFYICIGSLCWSARHFRRNTRVIGPRLTVSTQIASQNWDRTAPERDCREATIIRPIKLSPSFSVHCEVARVVGTNIARPAVNRIGGQQMKKLQIKKLV